MTAIDESSGLRSASGAVIAALDRALPLVLVFKLSGAWLYPGMAPNDTAPGLALVNLAFLVACLYGTLRLVGTKAHALLFAEPIFAGFLGFACVAILWFVSPVNSFGMARTAVLFFAACVFLRYRFTPTELLHSVLTVLSVLLVASIAYALVHPAGVMTGLDAGRWRGVFNHKNALGEQAAVTLIVAGALYTQGPRHKTLRAAQGGLALVCLLMAGSATAWGAAVIAAVVGMLGITITRANLVRRQALVVFLGLAIAIPFIAIGFVEIVAEQLGRDLTFTGRTQIWEHFLAFADQRPVTGWGWATIQSSLDMLPIIRQSLNLPFIQTPHSGYISLIVELGYPGFALFVAWLAAAFLASSHQAIINRDRNGLLRCAVISGLAFHSIFESTSGAMPSLWLLVLLTTGRRTQLRLQ